eukprot:364369-Chlamydomonas_euryale.AAC.1
MHFAHTIQGGPLDGQPLPEGYAGGSVGATQRVERASGSAPAGRRAKPAVPAAPAPQPTKHPSSAGGPATSLGKRKAGTPLMPSESDSGRGRPDGSTAPAAETGASEAQRQRKQQRLEHQQANERQQQQPNHQQQQPNQQQQEKQQQHEKRQHVGSERQASGGGSGGGNSGDGALFGLDAKTAAPAPAAAGNASPAGVAGGF